jgi:pimeloyl-ACP methyl ester carboxylesterase
MPILKQTMEQYQQMTMEEIADLRIRNAFGKLASKQMVQYLVDIVVKTPKEIYLDYAASTLDYDFSAHYPNIKAKTLIVSGELDQAATPDSNRKIQAAIADSKSLILKDTGHALSLENPVEMNRAVMDFLRD